MKVHKITDFKGGWYCGAFTPTAHYTSDFEVAYKVHAKGEVWPKHYHAIATEYNLIISGKMKMQGVVYGAGDIVVMEPMDVADPEFLEECQMVVVKVPSVANDKFEVD